MTQSESEKSIGNITQYSNGKSYTVNESFLPLLKIANFALGSF